MKFLLLVCLTLMILFGDMIPVYGQQCLDLMPPFVPTIPLRFCDQYSRYGCCTTRDDTYLREMFDRISDLSRRNENGNRRINSTCLPDVKSLLCARCSPFSAVLFQDPEPMDQSQTPRIFPGLCGDFCTRFYDRCVDNVLQDYLTVIYNSEERKERAVYLNALTISESPAAFCEAVALSNHESQFCHPIVDASFGEGSRFTRDKVNTASCVCLQPYNLSFKNPLVVTNANDGSGRLFIAEQLGTVNIVFSNGSVPEEYFLNLQAKIYQNGNGYSQLGLLGLTFHPNFKDNHKLYVAYTAKVNRESALVLRVEEYRVMDTDTNKVDPGSARIIIEIQKVTVNHAGGQLLFAKDGYLYIFAGDDGGDGDVMEISQDLFMYSGKVLRVNVDVTDFEAGREYSIPSDNPFVGQEDVALPEIYAWGLRNPWRCSSDRAYLDRIFCGDPGLDTYEEINIIKKKANYGWNVKEGTEDFCPECLRGLPEVNLTDPIFEYRHTIGIAVIGGYMYRGCLSPNLYGQYIFGDYKTGLFRLHEDHEKQTWSGERLELCPASECLSPLESEIEPYILSFGEDEDGEIHLLTTSTPTSLTSPNGRLYKIVDPIRRGNPKHCQSARQANGRSAVSGDPLPPVVPDPSRGGVSTTTEPPTTTTQPPQTTPRQQRPVPDPRRRGPPTTQTPRGERQRPRSRFNFLRRIFSRRGNSRNEENQTRNNSGNNRQPASNQDVGSNIISLGGRKANVRRNQGATVISVGKKK